MLTKFRATGLVWSTILALAALVVLVGLGNWQMSRKAWKDGLIRQVEAGLGAAPVALDDALRGWPCKAGSACPFPEYARVLVRGRFEHDRERFFYAPDPGLGPGVHVYTPLVLDDGRRVMVNRGYVPDRLREPQSRAEGQVQVRVEIVGLLRGPGEKAAFTPDNDPVRNAWYWRDIDAMADCANVTAGSSAERCGTFVRVFVDAEASPANRGGWPKGGATNLQIANRHLEYALTWYGLAIALIAFYLVFARGRLKSDDSSS